MCQPAKAAPHGRGANYVVVNAEGFCYNKPGMLTKGMTSLKLFISADIEGTCGIAHWDETEKGHDLYAHFATQMSREVAAACEGAIDAGFDEILVKDAHDSARNIDPNLLPECVRILRGWGADPLCMMAGLDSSFHGVVFTGYHSGAGSDGNPLSHTMTTQALSILINGQPASELHINCLIAAYFGVPVYCVTGDKRLCDWMKTQNPHTARVSVVEGLGGGSISPHPAVAIRSIRTAVAEALRSPGDSRLFPMPESIEMTVSFREHFDAKKGGFYPGARQTDARTVTYKSHDLMDVLKFMMFVVN